MSDRRIYPRVAQLRVRPFAFSDSLAQGGVANSITQPDHRLNVKASTALWYLFWKYANPELVDVRFDCDNM